MWRHDVKPLRSAHLPAAEIAREARALVASAAGILLDWDGCVALRDVPHTAGLAFLRRYADKIAIVSNNSTLWPSDIQRILALRGIQIPVGRIVLAGHQAVLKAAQLGLATTVLGDLHMRALARELGVQQVTRNPQVLVLLRDTRFSYARLMLGVNALASGARLIVANPDLSHPGPQGRIVPETGALLAALVACVPLSGNAMDVIGKPYPEMFHMASASLGLEAAQALMIGDNPTTDIDGGRRLGMKTVLVSPGSALSLVDLC